MKNETTSKTTALAPVIKTVVVKAPLDAAFRRFTGEIGTWWPLQTHSVGQGDAQTVAFEERVGGRILESIRGRDACAWGTVTAWDPPRRVAFTWHPGRDPEGAQDVEVTFVAVGAETRVRLVHSGFERLGALAKKARSGYNVGWIPVLARYTGSRGPLVRALDLLTDVAIWFRRRKKRRESDAPTSN